MRDIDGGEAIARRLSHLTNGFGPFAPRPDADLEQLGHSMISEIDDVEKLAQGGMSSANQYQLALAIRNYCSWYVRGAERAEYLQRSLSYLRKAITTDGCAAAKIELVHILIDEKLVRDLPLALTLADELTETGLLPDWMQSFVEKAKRWSGNASIPSDNDFSNITATPASIREERTKLRKLVIVAVKAKDTARATALASRLYNLGLLAAYLYGHWDASSGVSGVAFNAAAQRLPGAKASFNFGYLGRIADAEFLSAADYKRLEQLLGSKSSTISVREIHALISGMPN